MTIEEAKKKGAKYYRLNPSKKFIEQFYTIEKRWVIDGTVMDVLFYYSECGSGWTPSDHNGDKMLDYVKNHLTEIQ